MTNTTATEPDARPILERARAAMHGRSKIETALSEVAEQLQQARGAIRPEETVVDVALEVIRDGGAVPDDLGDRVLKIRRANESAFAEASVLGPLESRLRERLLAVHREQADDALTVLADELLELLTAARPVLARLGSDVDSADTAITSGRVNEWRQAGQLGTRYTEVRDVQRIVVAGALDPPDQARVTSRVSATVRDLVDNFGVVRQPHLHFPEVGTGVNRSEVRVGQSRIFSGRIVTDAHTDRPARPRPWTTGDPVADLRFLVRDHVIAWVPTVAELTGARDEHERRKQAEARAEAERRPGDEQPERRLPRGRQMPPPSAALIDRLAREELGEPV
ncbi:MAG: hypothetical protein H0U62_13265 [Actinobacteria bacterium]|nr:hypothetical protein [Actinomycetota bacterium]